MGDARGGARARRAAPGARASVRRLRERRPAGPRGRDSQQAFAEAEEDSQDGGGGLGGGRHW